MKQLKAQLRVAELPARDPLQLHAEANLLAAQADADKARSDLADRTVLAPTGGRVERLYFAAGEMAAAGTPVLAVLPTDALKVKFYVGEADRPQFALGDVVAVSCDGCPDGLTATLSYFAARPAVHAAGDLLARRAAAAELSGRGDARRRTATCCRASR